ncbi:uncharacterized protein LOC117196525 [Orcinus orca]|uniref:uncharacterized protein LOC117196525 n=1 Tax=Orcinus orca TaxID=9733 RepID=UPI0021127C26|nr:uncharacterized protein LOC117196525 [Orcinus orca]XP_049571911.1 uncharacterized protein LOC117196525 [Orcinus orca]
MGGGWESGTCPKDQEPALARCGHRRPGIGCWHLGHLGHWEMRPEWVCPHHLPRAGSSWPAETWVGGLDSGLGALCPADLCTGVFSLPTRKTAAQRGSGKQLSCASLCRRWRAAIVLPLSLRAPLGSTSILKVGPWSRVTQGDSRGEVRLGLELGFESRSSGGAGRAGPEPACASWFPPQAGSPGVCRRPREGNKCVLFFFKINLFIYFWLCWVFVSVRGLSLVAASGGHSSSRCAGLSLSWPLLLRSTGSRYAGSVVVAHGPSCSTACGIFPGQGSNPCPLHWQADSQPLRRQGSPTSVFLTEALA